MTWATPASVKINPGQWDVHLKFTVSTGQGIGSSEASLRTEDGEVCFLIAVPNLGGLTYKVEPRGMRFKALRDITLTLWLDDEIQLVSWTLEVTPAAEGTAPS